MINFNKSINIKYVNHKINCTKLKKLIERLVLTFEFEVTWFCMWTKNKNTELADRAPTEFNSMTNMK